MKKEGSLLEVKEEFVLWKSGGGGSSGNSMSKDLEA